MRLGLPVVAVAAGWALYVANAPPFIRVWIR